MKFQLIFRTILSFSIFTFVLSSCQNPNKTESTLTTLDIIPALTNYKEFRLSELVDSIEYIKLETRKECLVSNGSKTIIRSFG